MNDQVLEKLTCKNCGEEYTIEENNRLSDAHDSLDIRFRLPNQNDSTKIVVVRTDDIVASIGLHDVILLDIYEGALDGVPQGAYQIRGVHNDGGCEASFLASLIDCLEESKVLFRLLEPYCFHATPQEEPWVTTMKGEHILHDNEGNVLIDEKGNYKSLPSLTIYAESPTNKILDEA